LRRSLHGGHAISSVLQVTPAAPGTMIQIGGHLRQGIAKLFWRADAAAPGQDVPK